MFPGILEKGDLISIIAPASNVDAGKIESAKEALISWGLNVRVACDTSNEKSYFAGQDETRLKNIQEQFNDPGVKAIIATRGGYGTTRIIDSLDLSGFIKYPKWFVGFSDLTVLHARIQLNDIPSIHGPMAIHFSDPAFKKSISDLKRLLFTGNLSLDFISDPLNRPGYCRAKITGGNLSLLCNSLGTKTEILPEGKILFIEDIDEYYYNIDRMIVQLKRAGKFDNLAGLLVGQFNEIKDGEVSFGKSIREIIYDHVSEYDFPVSFEMPSGHGNPNFPIIFGKTIVFSVDENNTLLNFG